ncbi:hypothetical protein CMI37_37330 [Candidatus Pacearchaeota archaeon]|nr:hypothetical protein [Candidatus Pacearchaeota archaeon]
MNLQETFRREIVSGLLEERGTLSLIKKWLQLSQLTQSQLIRFGTLFENAVNCLAADSHKQFTAVTTNGRKTYITPTAQITHTSKGNKDIDILFIDEEKMIVYYRESKCNLNLDSEKSIATVNKVKEVARRLQKAYAAYTIDAAILNMDWENPKQEYLGVPVQYMGDLFDLLGYKTSQQEYRRIGKSIGEEVRYATHS